MHIISDVQIAAGAGIVVLHFITTGVIAWRTFANGRGIGKARVQITDVSQVVDEVNTQTHIIRQALANIESATTGKTTYGRRATDVQPRRKTDTQPTSKMLPPNRWPIQP